MKKVGKVRINYLSRLPQNKTYEDKSEEFLSNFFDKPQSEKIEDIDKLLNTNPSWSIIYHLSPQREFLLEWYPFTNKQTILEIGAGCGALTGMFCRRLRKVYANELTSDRGNIIAKRFSDQKNLEVLIGNLQDINLKKKFDYVSVIGVFEYSGRYIKYQTESFHEPYSNFLKQITRYLKRGGHLLLAIENKIGLKYLAGGKEDHYGSLFSSIENYPDYSGIKTFTREELIQLLNKAGFSKISFFYPYPDYKLPHSILTEKGFHELNLSISSYSPIVDLANTRDYLFNEVAFANELKREKILCKFANSFLVNAQYGNSV